MILLEEFNNSFVVFIFILFGFVVGIFFIPIVLIYKQPSIKTWVEQYVKSKVLIYSMLVLLVIGSTFLFLFAYNYFTGRGILE